MSIQRHSFYNLAGSLAPAAVILITVPAYLRLIGDVRYGVLVIVWAFLGYFGVFDLGLGRAIARHIANLGQADPAKRSEAFWTALMLNAIFGVIGGLLIWPISQYYFAAHFQVAEPLRVEILAAIPWLAAAVPVATISGVLNGALQGRERFMALNASSVFGTVSFHLLPLVVAWMHGPDLAWLVPAALLGRVITCVALFVQCHRYVPLNMVPSVRRDLVAPFFRYGGWVTVTGIIGPVLTTLDRFLIGSIVGPPAVTYYSVPFSLVSQATILPNSLSSALFPRFSAVPKEECHRLMSEGLLTLSVILTPLLVAGILIMENFLTWWVGPGMARNSAFVGEIISLGLWFNGLAYLPYFRLQAQGRPDLVAKCHLVELIPYLAFLVFALNTWGVVGAALAWSLRAAVDAMLLLWIGGVTSDDFKAYLLPILLLGIASIAVFCFPMGSFPRLAVSASALLGSLAWTWWASPDSVRKFVRAGYQFLPRSR